ncbi:carboxypeptidase-like regulatory domain-containing protein [Flavivirga abyssicola]|uniref:carboxypeptidase-like regulatory domain-containing protein n=1 Tax=Flavivirga abyssicola TaxID=3063533 RepID=UPI0026E01190|nr:carboxypeptidase-like regulatory domain-containing protein [Flavivirga sp. MEBiC07777]WVK12762.1 carboxypeptidase-like regulatory domain-containing protein [Flavivirga sp. MEBiC07777]
MRNVIKIDIPKPCHENWNKMTPEEKGRHCKVCQKTVFDFTSQTDEYIVKTFTENSNVCGRFKSTQLKRDLVYSRKETNNYLSFLASGLFAILGFSSEYSYSQGRPKIVQLDTLQKDIQVNQNTINREKGNEIKGTIIDKSKTPLPDAVILIKGTTIGTVSDFDGNFSIKAKTGDILQVSYLGYKPKEIEINKKMPRVILLELEEVITGEIMTVVVGRAVGNSNYTCSPEELEKKRLNKLRRNNYFKFYKRQAKERKLKIKNGDIERSKLGAFFYNLFH